VIHLARCATQDFYNTDTSDMNESQPWSLPSLNFLSADSNWLDMNIWLFRLNPYLHSGETRYNLNNWCFWLLSILNLLIKSNQKWLQVSKCVKQNSLGEFPRKRLRTVGLSMDIKYECEAVYIWSILAKLG